MLKVASLGSGLLVVLTGVLGVVGSARAGQDCQPPEAPRLFMNTGALQEIGSVPSNGIIALQAYAYGPIDEAIELLTLSVTRDDVDVPGEIETVAVSSNIELGVETHELFVVWRPAEPFAGLDEYVLHYLVAGPGAFEYDIPVYTIGSPAGALPVPGIEIVDFATLSLGIEPKVCCETNDPMACGEPECRAPLVADYAWPEAFISIGNDPHFSQSYARLRAGIDGATEPQTVLGMPYGLDGWFALRSIREFGETYCLGVDVVSLIDGSVGETAIDCVDGEGLAFAPEPSRGFDAFLEECVGAPYWEDTGEPYEPQGETTGGPMDDSGGSGEGGSVSAGDGSSPESGGAEGDESSEDDVGDVDDDDGSSSDESSEPGAQGSADDGCGCAAHRDASTPAWFLALLLGIGGRRRRVRESACSTTWA